jgi:hypothetical protein
MPTEYYLRCVWVRENTSKVYWPAIKLQATKMITLLASAHTVQTYVAMRPSKA